MLSLQGYCPVCEAPATFYSEHLWFRDHLFCETCQSIPRERAMALVLNEFRPKWRTLRIHESSPEFRGVSRKLAQQCANYVATQYRPDHPLGVVIEGHRNENLEQQTFRDHEFDLVVSLDVMEHVNDPEACFREIWRTLEPGGAYIFTAPTYKESVRTERAARFLDNGELELYREPEYHGNPINPQGSIVTFRYGYDFPELIARWAPFEVRVVRFHDRRHAIIGEFTETYVCAR
jgi:SAM-dependent methyltransferase